MLVPACTWQGAALSHAQCLATCAPQVAWETHAPDPSAVAGTLAALDEQVGCSKVEGGAGVGCWLDARALVHLCGWMHALHTDGVAEFAIHFTHP